MTKYLVLDYETFSHCDLKQSGAFEYAAHESTEILCVAWAFGTKQELRKAPVKLWSPYGKFASETSKNFGELCKYLLDPEVMLVAHNALFEQVITRFVFGKKLMYSKPELQNIGPSRWICTASLARSMGFPGKLKEAGAALGLKQQKDNDGHKLMLKLSKPRNPSKQNPDTRHRNDYEYERLFEYCRQDIRSEIDLFLALPPLVEKERKLWELDQKMNLEGFQVDRDLVLGALKLLPIEAEKMKAEVKELTKGYIDSATQREKLLKWMRKKEGLSMPDLRAGTVTNFLEKEEVTGRARRLLEIRQEASKSSTAKYLAFEARSRYDGRARDNLIFYGAHTGRLSGTGLQPQNLFKTVIPQEDVVAGLPLISRGDYHAIDALYPNPMKLYASSLRSCIIAPPGKTLDVGDFATIEVRVLFWLAGNSKGLKAIIEGRDLYLEQAAVIFGYPLDKLTKDYKAKKTYAMQARQLGKEVVLGAGFGIGSKRFKLSCEQKRLPITDELASKAVESYRSEHQRIPIFWRNIEKAAIMAVKNAGKKYKLGYLVLAVEKDHLTIQLPIGRKLHYYKPMVRKSEKVWGEQEILTYIAQNSKTRAFSRIDSWGGILTENIVQAVARDILAEASLRLDATGVYKLVISIHDELGCERELNRGSLEEFTKLMSQVPEWAKGLPIKVEAWSEPRYRK